MSELHAAVTAEVEAHRPDEIPPFATVLARRRARARRRRVLLAGAPVLAAVLAAPLVWTALGGERGGDRLLQQGGSDPATVVPATFSGRLVLEAAPADQAVGAVATPAVAGTAPFPAGYSCGVEPFVDDPAAEVVVCSSADPAGAQELVRLGPAVLTAAELASAVANQDPAGRWSVLVEFKPQGAQAWADLTGEAACSALGEPTRRVGLLVDGVLISSPSVSPDVACGVGIVGGATTLSLDDGGQGQAEDLAARLSAAAGPTGTEENRALLSTYGLSADGRTLTVQVPVGGCGPAPVGSASVQVEQDEDQVVVTGSARAPQPVDPGVLCRGPLRLEAVTVELDAPLGGRPVLDGSEPGRRLTLLVEG